MSFRDRITLRSLPVSCILGLAREERNKAQSIIVDVAFQLDTRQAATASDVLWTIDYAKTAGQVTFVLQEAQFYLLETAADFLVRTLAQIGAATNANVFVPNITLTLTKPEALGGKGIPSLQLERSAGTFAPLARESFAWGNAIVVAASREASVQLISAKKHQKFLLPREESTSQSVMVVSGSVLIHGTFADAGSAWVSHDHQGDQLETKNDAILLIVRRAHAPSTFHERSQTQATLPKQIILKAFYPLATSTYETITTRP